MPTLTRRVALCAAVLGLAAAAPATGVAATGPYAPPTPSYAQFHDRLALTWKWHAKTTRLLSASVAVAGPAVTMTAEYLHGAKVVWQLTADGKSQIARGLATLERRIFRPGYQLELVLGKPKTLPQEAVFSFRRNRIPSVRIRYPAP